MNIDESGLKIVYGFLSSIFSLEILSYAIMSNYFHIVLKAIPDETTDLSDKDVVRRWLSIYRGPLIANRYLEGADLSKGEKETLFSFVNCWRERLADISWFMKCLNELIARQANKEDGCTVSYWTLLLLFGHWRSLSVVKHRALKNQGSGIRFDFNEYLELLDFTGRAIIQNKSGHIDNCLPSILHRLSIRPKTWFENVLNFEILYYQRFAHSFY